MMFSTFSTSPTPPTPRTWASNGPLDRGVTLLEASAGTGKTYQIVHIVMRLIAEEAIAIENILVMTFTRAATAELRERLHGRLKAGARALAEVVVHGPGACTSTDTTLRAWAEALASDGRAGTALRRLEKALVAIDNASVLTIHSFCQRMLTRFAFDSDTAHDVELVSDVSAVLRDFVADFLTAVGFDADDATWKELTEGRSAVAPAAWMKLAQLALLDPDAPFDPAPDGTSLYEEARREAIGAVVAPLAALWQAESESMVAWLDASYANGTLRETARSMKYKPASNRTYADNIGAWIADPFTATAPSPSQFKHFSPAEIASNIASRAGGTEIPAPFARFQRLLERAEKVIDSGAQSSILSLQQRFIAMLRNAWPTLMRDRGQMAFQDLLERLAAALGDTTPDSRGARLRDGIRSAYRAVLVDEFQDTDRVQWSVFEATFANDPNAFLYLIGDPKQAIYGFRGANIAVYFSAAEYAGSNRYTLNTNFRSDPSVMDAFNRLFGQPAFFDVPFLDYVPNAPARASDRLDPGRSFLGTGPFHIRHVGAPGRRWSSTALMGVLPGVVAADIAALLASGVTILRKDDVRTPVTPGDIAVVVAGHHQARLVSRALFDRGIANVRGNSGSVFDSEAFAAMLAWLAALRDPEDEGQRRLLALSPLLGWTPADLASVGDDASGTSPGTSSGTSSGGDWARLTRRVQRWRTTFDRYGILAAWRRTVEDENIDGRLLRLQDGDRWMTDLRHLIELLHVVQTSERRGLIGLWQWLAHQAEKGATEENPRRLERDDAAVRIVTMHASKGLEYPIVFAPFLWGSKKIAPPLLVAHPAASTRRILCLATNSGSASMASRAQREEMLRLLYVAWTRAQLALVTYTAPVGEPSWPQLSRSPVGAALHAGPVAVASGESRIDAAEARLSRLLGAAAAAGASEHSGAAEGEGALWADLQALVADGIIAATTIDDPEGMSRPSRAIATPDTFSTNSATAPSDLRARPLSRAAFDSTFALLSYTALVRGHEHRGAQSPEREGADHDTVVGPTFGAPIALDMQPSDAPAQPAARPAASHIDTLLPEVPLAVFPVGADAGVALHGIFEDLDFAAIDAPTAVQPTLRDRLRRHGLAVAPEHIARVADGFFRVLTTPLGGPVGAFRLADLQRPPRWPAKPAPDAALRLDELRFDFPVAGGTAWRASAHAPADGALVAKTFETIATAIIEANLDPVAPPSLMSAHNARTLASLDFGPLAGLFKGFIDLIFRAPTPAGPRYFVADYKSNRLKLPAPFPGAPIRTTIACYTEDMMRAEMERHQYHLQASLYALALHRFLRARLGAAYDYDIHVGGSYYLFVRGMIGPDTPRTAPRMAPPHVAAACAPAAAPMPVESVHGVWFERAPRALIEALDAALPAGLIPLDAASPSESPRC